MNLSFDTDDVIILDDIISEDDSNSIHNMFLHAEFPWYFLQSTVTKQMREIVSDENTYDSPQLVSLMYADYEPISKHWNLCNLDSLSHKISKRLGHKLSYKRVKANLLLNNTNTSDQYLPAHIDNGLEDHLVMIYFVNSTDSPTTIFKNNSKPWIIETQVESKQGRIVIFSGKKYHAGMNPIKSPYRIIVNFNITNMEKIYED